MSPSDEDARLRTCGQHPLLGAVTFCGTRACGQVLAVAQLYRCADCRTAFCRDCIERHFGDMKATAQDARWKAQIAAEADGDDPRDVAEDAE